MALARKKSELPERDLRLHSNDNKKMELPRAANDNENSEAQEAKFSEKLELDLKSDRYLEVHRSDIKALRAFRRAFNLHNHDLNNWSIVVVNEERNVAVTRAFELKSSKNLTFITSSNAAARMLEQKGGIEAKKGNIEQKKLDEPARIVIAMNEDLHPTPHLLESVAPRGFFLCTIGTANALRSHKFDLVGVIDDDGADPRIDKNVGEDFWNNASVSNDEEYGKAANIEGTVDRDYAAEKLEDAGVTMKAGNTDVIAEYSALLDKARREGNHPGADGNLTYQTTKDGAEVLITLNARMRTRENDFKNATIIMQRRAS